MTATVSKEEEKFVAISLDAGEDAVEMVLDAIGYFLSAPGVNPATLHVEPFETVPTAFDFALRIRYEVRA